MLQRYSQYPEPNAAGVPGLQPKPISHASLETVEMVCQCMCKQLRLNEPGV